MPSTLWWAQRGYLLVISLLFSAEILTVAAQKTNETDSNADLTQSGKWINGEYLEEDEANLQFDKRIRAVTFLKNNRPCMTSSGSPGKCLQRRYCIANRLNFGQPTGADYCLYHGKFVGVCCPDQQQFTQVPILSASTPSAPMTTGIQKETSQTAAGPLLNASQSGCGLALPHEGGVVEGWRVSGKGRWPWIAALMRKNGTIQFCGGTLITNRHVLTAAHCLQGISPSGLSVRLGEFDLEETSDKEIVVGVGEFIPYHAYNRITYENDIAILVLSKKVEFNRGAIWPACLPPESPSDEEIEENDPLMNLTAIVSGWGRLYYKGPTSDILNEVEVPIWSQKDCRNAYVQPIMHSALCAGYRSGGKDSCQGDSGGPLVMMAESGRWDVVGVVSWGIKCADPGKPGVYTRVGKYLDWILEVTS